MTPIVFGTFVIVIATLFSTIGYSPIIARIYNLYVSIALKSQHETKTKLKRDIVQIKSELSRTSAMDEFAKWAKLRRKADKKQSEYETLLRETSMHKTTMTLKLQFILRVAIGLAQVGVLIAYRSVPVYWVPEGWLGPLENLLCWPFAPYGAVGMAVWVFIVGKVVRRMVEMYVVHFV